MTGMKTNKKRPVDCSKRDYAPSRIPQPAPGDPKKTTESKLMFAQTSGKSSSMRQEDRYWQLLFASPDADFQHAAKQFCFRLETKRRSPGTKRDYGYRLWDFHRFLANRQLNFTAVSKQTVRDYLDALQQRSYGNQAKRLSPETIRGFYRGLNAFFNFLEKYDIWTGKNPMRGVEPPESKRLDFKLVLSKEDIDLLLDIPNKKTVTGKRHRLIINILWRTAMRVSELCGIKVSDLDLSHKDAYISVIRKRGKPQDIPIEADLAGEIEGYVYERGLQPHDYLLSTRNGRPLHQRNVRRILERVFEKTRKSNPGRWSDSFKIHPHLFRHSRLTFLAGTMNELYLKHFAGHSDLRTTELYIHFSKIDRGRIREEYLKAVQQPQNGNSRYAH